ncbi:MAG: hypothetical protein IKX31_11540 [Muribaculaceae bacterium]|nr:hypothetical protein [Muribaculaceae bacterium]
MISQEMSLIKDYWHCQPCHYIRYRLYEIDLETESLLDYVPPYLFYNYFLPSHTIIGKSDFSNDKLTQYRLFKSKGVPTPRVIAVYKKGKLYNLDNELIDINSLNSSSSRLFIKPFNGSGGKGILVFDKINGKYYINDMHVTAELMKKELKNNCSYIFQEKVQQCDELNQIYPHSLNTIRVITHEFDTGIKVCYCILRLGRGGKCVDNNTQGGMSVNIQIETGYFSDYAITEHGLEKFYRHPDTGFVFKGNRINNWKQVLNEITEIASMFSGFGAIGWDFAISQSGVQLIEMNLGYGIDHVQISCGGVRRILNIYPR